MVELCNGLGTLGGKHLDLLVGGEQAGLALLQLRGLRAKRRVGLLGALHGAGARLHQIVVAGLLFLREFEVGFGGVDLGGLLLDQRLLQFDLRVEILHRGFGRRDVGLGLVQRSPEIAVVDPRQQLPGLDRLVVADQHLVDVTGDFRRDDRGVRLHIGVVGALEITAGREIVVAEVGGAGDAEGQRQRERGAPDRLT